MEGGGIERERMMEGVGGRKGGGGGYRREGGKWVDIEERGEGGSGRREGERGW